MKALRAVVVLGAGASRGANVSGGKTPPLDSDLLRVASGMFAHRRAKGPHRPSVLAWRNFDRHLRSAGLRFEDIKSWRLEQLATFLEARANLKGLQLGVGRPKEHAQALLALRILVCHVLRSSGGAAGCSLHRLLFRTIKLGAVISFNYDLIADQTLLELGWLNWTKRDYSGGGVARVASATGKAYSRQIHARHMRDTVPLLKLHGSVHWERTKWKGRYRLSGVRLPDAQRSTFDINWVPEDPFLIPPVASKIDISESSLREHWYEAVHQLHDAPSWIIWGYSFPTTDTIAQVLFKTALARNKKPKPVIVVNPDWSVADRVLEVCRKVRVERFMSIESLLHHWAVLTEAGGE